jgi:hypothetical protein
VVNSLHFAHHYHPVLQLLHNANQYTVTMVLCLVKNLQSTMVQILSDIMKVKNTLVKSVQCHGVHHLQLCL